MKKVISTGAKLVSKKVHYSVTPRKNPMRPEEQPKFHANAQIWSVVNENELAEIISKRCTLTKHDLAAALSSLGEVICEILMSGQGVRLRNFGTFHLSITSEGTATKEEFGMENIKGVNVRFVGGEEFKVMTRTLSFIETGPKTITTEVTNEPTAEIQN